MVESSARARRPWHILIIVLAGLVAAAPATNPATQPSMIYTPPAGWTKVERDRLTIYVAPDAKEGDSTAIVLWPAGVLTGDFSEAFKEHRLDARGGMDLLRAGELKKTKTAAGDEALSAQEVLQDSAGHKSLRDYLAVRRGSQMEVCMFVADTIDGFTAHAKDADAFIGSLRFPTAATMPATKPVR